MSERWPDIPGPVVSASQLPAQPARRRTRVLHVITKFWAGAGGNTLLSAVGADPEHYEVWVAGASGGPLWDRAERAGVHTVRLPRFRETLAPVEDLVVLVQLVQLMRRERFTIVHTHSSKAGFLGRLAAWLTGTPVVVHTFHGFSVHDQMGRTRRAFYLLLERLVRPMTDCFFAVAPSVAREAVELRLAPPGRVTVVPSAVDVDEIPTEPDRALLTEIGVPAGRRVVGTVGRLDPQKAPHDFVRMAAAISRCRDDVSFVMVGEGSLEADVRAEAARLGAEVILTGFRPDAPALAACFDVFVISSLYEGLGRALTEALASSRPVVATAVNGVPDLVEPGCTGLLATPGDPSSLASGVQWLLDHPEAARRMGAQGRRRVLEHFRPQLMCDLIDRTYCELLGVPPRAQRAAAGGVALEWRSA